MNKKEMSIEIARRTGRPKVATADFMNAFMEILADEMRAGNRVCLDGIGTFLVTERAERIGNNLQTREKVIIPAHNVVQFKPAKYLKDAANGGE